jgi:hypothetical protein
MKPFRIPLVGPYISRVSSPSTSSGIVGIGVVGLMVVGQSSSSTTKDARYINVYSQTVPDPLTGGKRVYAVKRPGFATHTTPASGEKGYAVHVWIGETSGTKVISAFGETNSTVYDGTTSLGAITGRATGITETFVSTTPTLMVTSTDNTAWYYDAGVGTMTKISDADFPGNNGETLAGTFAHIDGYAVVMDEDGVVWASDLNSVTAWTATSFDSANAYPDKGVGVVRHRQFIMAFGTESVQFFYNAGLTPFPLSKATAMTQKVGAVHADAIAQIADTTFWCGSTEQGGLSIFQYDGDLTRISTPEIDATLVLSGASTISLSPIRFAGRSFILVRAGSLTIAYCVEEKFWHEWTSTTPLWYKCAGLTNVGGSMVNYAVSNVATDGKVFVMNQASPVFTDNGNAYTATIQLPLQDLGTKRTKFWHEIELVGDEEESASTVTLKYTDDDYQNFTTHGSSDLSNDRVRFTRLGSSRRRGWQITHAANTPMRLEALEGNVTVGSS